MLGITFSPGCIRPGYSAKPRRRGGLIYLPFDPRIVGRQGVELNRIGALSGMDGIVSVLNRHRELSGVPGSKFTGVSKLAKLIYDRVHETYDGQCDQAQNQYVDYRTTFFSVEELTRLAEQLEAGRPETPQ